jgi:hypothetical protein
VHQVWRSVFVVVHPVNCAIPLVAVAFVQAVVSSHCSLSSFATYPQWQEGGTWCPTTSEMITEVIWRKVRMTMMRVIETQYNSEEDSEVQSGGSRIGGNISSTRTRSRRPDTASLTFALLISSRLCTYFRRKHWNCHE